MFKIDGSLCGSHEESSVLSLNNGTMVNVTGPFSTLHERLGFQTVYKMMLKATADIHKQLEEIHEINLASVLDNVRNGVKIISYADPGAQIELMGRRRYRSFSADYTYKLLRQLEGKMGKSVIHVCPHCSLFMEQSGLISSFRHQVEEGDFLDRLKEAPFEFSGHQCIHSYRVKELFGIEVIFNERKT